MSEKHTLNLYEVLEVLNDKINSNRNQTNQLKLQLDETKVYLLEKIEHKAKKSLDFLNSELKKEAFENRKHINSKHERLVTDEFKKLKTDINKDLEDLANRVMNSRIL
tara:strand:- start:156 stop:479 length:324 start_codon:yes stop_codon:yes gene_type:complete